MLVCPSTMSTGWAPPSGAGGDIWRCPFLAWMDPYIPRPLRSIPGIVSASAFPPKFSSQSTGACEEKFCVQLNANKLFTLGVGCLCDKSRAFYSALGHKGAAVNRIPTSSTIGGERTGLVLPVLSLPSINFHHQYFSVSQYYHGSINDKCKN